jgi:hypothetical protein
MTGKADAWRAQILRLRESQSAAEEKGSGMQPDNWGNYVFSQTVHANSFYQPGKELSDQLRSVITAGIAGIAPKDSLEDMIAAQMLACHDAAMDCYERAQGEKYSQGRRDYLNQAGKLSRTFAMMLDTLNRHRGKGQQKITVEHVHVHPGGQAVVGIVDAPGGGVNAKAECLPDNRKEAHVSRTSLRSEDAQGDALPAPGDTEKRPV